MTEQNAASILALLHISSPALPVGAFAYSQGLEYALDKGWCKNRDDVQRWIEDSFEFGLGQLDLPIYLRIYRAWKAADYAAVSHWNQSLLSFRETKELYLEDIQVGGAFAQWHLGQCKSVQSKRAQCNGAQNAERQSYLDHCPQPTVVAMNALAAVLSDIDENTALLGFAWSWVENQIACASKAMPMGQTDGQRILQQIIPLITRVCAVADDIEDEQIGTGLMGLAMASSLHEQQYSRLFRS